MSWLDQWFGVTIGVVLLALLLRSALRRSLGVRENDTEKQLTGLEEVLSQPVLLPVLLLAALLSLGPRLFSLLT
jgi:hypothetical protein